MFWKTVSVFYKTNLGYLSNIYYRYSIFISILWEKSCVHIFPLLFETPASASHGDSFWDFARTGGDTAVLRPWC